MRDLAKRRFQKYWIQSNKRNNQNSKSKRQDNYVK